MIRVAMGQMKVEGNKVSENLSRAVGMIELAAKRGHDLIVLPECLDIGWTCQDANVLAGQIPGEISNVLCQSAKTQNIYVVAGLTEKSNGRLYSSALLISPQGAVLLKHRKINILRIARHIYSIGRTLSVVETELGNIGIPICADNFPNSHAIAHALARMGADVILSPCSWAVPPNHDNRIKPYGDMWERSYVRIARLFNIPIVGVSNTGTIESGPWKDYRCIGCSLAVSAEGRILIKGEYSHTEQSLLSVDVELAKNKKVGTEISDMLEEKVVDSGLITDCI